MLESTARAVAGRVRMAAVAGDLETERDADRLRAAGVPAVAITTGSACHLDATMVHRAVHGLEGSVDWLFIENVGNLVCPAVYDLGEAASVVALSVTEGEDKPLKYPVMFRKADLVLVTKCDLLPHLDVSMDALLDALSRVMPAPEVIRFSSRTGEGLAEWLAWLERRRAAQTSATLPEARADASPRPHPHGPRHDHDHGHGEAMTHDHEHDRARGPATAQADDRHRDQVHRRAQENARPRAPRPGRRRTRSSPHR